MMNLDNLRHIVNFGESHTVEFKKSTARLKSVCETASAFLNTDGGNILIGVTDDKRVVGQEVSDKTKREIGNELSKITPIPNIEVNYIQLPGADKYVIDFHVTTDSTKRPYIYDGRAFLRSQSDTVLMPREYLHQLTLINANGNHAWENHVLPHVLIDDLDEQEILTTIKEGSLNGRIPESYLTDDPWVALQHLGLVENGKIINAEKQVDFEYLTERQQEILTVLKNHGAQSTDGLLKLMKNPPSERWLRSELNRLKDLKMIDVKGYTAARRWFLIK